MVGEALNDTGMGKSEAVLMTGRYKAEFRAELIDKLLAGRTLAAMMRCDYELVHFQSHPH